MLLLYQGLPFCVNIWKICLSAVPVEQSVSQQEIFILGWNDFELWTGTVNFCASFAFSSRKLLRGNAKLIHRYSLIAPWTVVGSCGLPLPLQSQAKPEAAESVAGRWLTTMHCHICESALLLATFAKWPEKGSGDAYQPVHLKNVKTNILNLDLLYFPVCKDKNKRKIGVDSGLVKSGQGIAPKMHKDQTR